jgi:repressor LexA
MSKREAICAAIARHWRDHGYAPTRREIVEMTGISSTSIVAYHLLRLERDGAVENDGRKARTLRLTEMGEELAGI